jgi:peptidoglycan/xylan/chitin deacetylase (PgdA/CDA1 family)
MMPVVARRTVLRGVKTTAWVADRLRKPDRGVVVLLYHRVGGGSEHEMDLPADLFARQLEVLSAGDVVALPTAVAALASGNKGWDRRPPVVVSFDDGTIDFVETALPLLVRYSIPVTLYLATGFVEGRRPFPRGGMPLSWGALREALATGLVTIGSHTHSHTLLHRVTPTEAEAELRRSIDLVGDRLGVAAEHFAYPKAALPQDTVEAIVRRLFVSAAIGGNRANVPGRTDVHRLARSPIQATDGMRWFASKLAGGLALEERLRGALRGVRIPSAAASTYVHRVT